MFKNKKSPRNSRNNDSNNGIFSYYQNRDQSGSNNSQAKLSNKRSNIITNIPVILSVIAIIASIIFVISLSTNPSIVIVNKDSLLATGDNVDELDQIVSKKLKQSLLNKSKITINTDKIQNELLNEIPEATDIAIALPIISRTPVVYVRIAEPSLLLNTQDKNDFVLDEKGRAISEVSKDMKELTIVKDSSGLAINLGDQAIPARQIDFINRVGEQFRKKNYKIEYFELSKNANELLVKLRREKFVIKYNLSGDERLQSGTALATLKYLKQKSIKPSQYIDVRVEERAYYK